MEKIAALSLAILSAFYSSALARQVEGRPTIPSDCTTGEVWVRDHSKISGEWTAFCRIRTGNSRSPAYNFWATKFKPGRPENWPMVLQEERTTNWQSKDVQDVFWSLDHIPKVLWDPQLRGIYRMNKSKDHPNPGLYWHEQIILYDPAFQNEEYTTQALAHELAHSRFDHFPNERRTSYSKAARVPSQESLDEDFARNVELFLFEPEKLKKTNSGAYEWIKKDVGGLQ